MRPGTSDIAMWSARLDETLPVVATRFRSLARRAVAVPDARVDGEQWCAEDVIDLYTVTL